jgi:3-oxoacyl-[acyl-carrier protein] reductase
MATKEAVEGLTRVLANEPSRAEDPGQSSGASAYGDCSLPRWQVRRTRAPHGEMYSLERLGAPEDIAGAVAFLVGPGGGRINGQVLGANSV